MRDHKPIRPSVFGTLQPRGQNLVAKSVLNNKGNHAIVEEQQSGQDLGDSN